MENFYSELIAGLLSGIISPILLYVGSRMIIKPKLIISDVFWEERKWVGFEANKHYGSTSIDVELVSSGYDFTIYGINVGNEHQKVIVRDPAKITSTTIVVFDSEGSQIIPKKDCRWWSNDLSEIDNLFVSKEEIDITTRRKQIISDGESRGLAINFQSDNGACYLFVIDSDRKSRFLDKEYLFKGRPPFYAKIFMKGNTYKEFNLQITDKNSQPILRKIDNLPFSINNKRIE